MPANELWGSLGADRGTAGRAVTALGSPVIGPSVPALTGSAAHRPWGWRAGPDPGVSRRSGWAWPARRSGGSGSWPVLARRSASRARPPGPGRGGSCPRERLSSLRGDHAMPQYARGRDYAEGSQEKHRHKEGMIGIGAEPLGTAMVAARTSRATAEMIRHMPALTAASGQRPAGDAGGRRGVMSSASPGMARRDVEPGARPGQCIGPRGERLAYPRVELVPGQPAVHERRSSAFRSRTRGRPATPTWRSAWQPASGGPAARVRRGQPGCRR